MDEQEAKNIIENINEYFRNTSKKQIKIDRKKFLESNKSQLPAEIVIDLINKKQNE